MSQFEAGYTCPPSVLVQVAAIASRFKGQPDRLNRVATEVKEIVPVLSKEVVGVIAREMGLRPTQVYNYITFYAMLSTRPHGKYTIHICKSAPCHVSGAAAVVKAIEEQLGVKMGETTPDGLFTLEYSPCLGLCDTAPAIMINKQVYGNLTPESVRDILKAYIREERAK